MSQIHAWKYDTDFSFGNLFSKDLPFYVNSGRIENKDILHVHIQPSIEIGCVIDGAGSLYSKGNTFTLTKGDFYFLDALMPHSHACATDIPMKTIYAEFKPQSIMSVLPVQGDMRLYMPFLLEHSGRSPVIEHADVCCELLQEALDLFRRRPDQWDVVGWNKILGCLFYTAEKILSPQQNIQGATWSKNHEIISNVIWYINSNVTKPITVRDMAQQCNLSTSRFTHIFSEYMHMPPVEYRNKLRISMAIEKILSTNEKLSTIILQCGFNNFSQFYKLFKRYCNQTPDSLRRNRKI